jgi:hypothetical protein
MSRSQTIASCGHKLTRKEIQTLDPVNVRAMARTGERAVSYILLCQKCLRYARSKGCVITSEAEQERWLAGLDKGETW